MHKYKWILFLIIAGLSCQKQNKTKTRSENFLQLSKEDRLKISQNSLKASMKKEQEQIKSYIKRKGGQFIQTPTGVHYFIYVNNGTEKKAKSADLASVKYTLTLLKGDTIRKENQEDFIIEFQEKESGLHECIKHLSVGDKAIIIIPSYRAYGLTGDDDKIPSLSTLVYNLELLNLK